MSKGRFSSELIYLVPGWNLLVFPFVPDSRKVYRSHSNLLGFLAYARTGLRRLEKSTFTSAPGDVRREGNLQFETKVEDRVGNR